MDDENQGNPPAGRKIALGLTLYLIRFADRQDAQYWKEFASEDPSRWRFCFLELADDPSTTILFNLHGIDVRIGLSRAATGRGTPTDWELLQIHEHESWWPRIEWWDEEHRASNPFDRGVEP